MSLHTYADRCATDAIVIPPTAVGPVALKSQSLDDLIELLGGDAPRAGGFESPWLPVWRIKAGHTLAHERAPLGYVYIVRGGVFKSSRMWEDGYEHVLGFASRGELIGFDGLYCGAYLESVIALDDATVYALPVDELARLRREAPQFERVLQMAVSRQLAYAAQIAEVLVAVAADTRMARFLLMYSRRMVERGESARRLHLPMPRRDLANLLGVACETVSRSLMALVMAGQLRVDNREIEILDLPGLIERTRTTRRVRGEAAHGASPSRRPREAGPGRDRASAH